MSTERTTGMDRPAYPIFAALADRPIAVVGDVMLDRFLYGYVERISPEAPVPVLRHRQTRSMLGGAGYVARNIAALGGQAVLVGLRGRDAAAAELARLVPDWRPASVEELQAQDMQAVLAMEPSLVLLGTGARQRFPAAEVLAAVLARGIGIEVMDSSAAARTFNVLATEGRRVVAAFLVPGTPEA